MNVGKAQGNFGGLKKEIIKRAYAGGKHPSEVLKHAIAHAKPAVEHLNAYIAGA